MGTRPVGLGNLTRGQFGTTGRIDVRTARPVRARAKVVELLLREEKMAEVVELVNQVLLWNCLEETVIPCNVVEPESVPSESSKAEFLSVGPSP